VKRSVTANKFFVRVYDFVMRLQNNLKALAPALISQTFIYKNTHQTKNCKEAFDW
jgi:menaquinone-dependent protoporphyrinogen IX oxidase